MEERRESRSTGRIVALTTIASGATLGAGFLLATTGEAIAVQTELGASFVAMLLGGIATSLPEASTAVAAVRLRQFEMLFGDAFGTNLFSIMAIFFADLAYGGGPVLNEVGRFGLFAVLLGIAVTAVYLAGCVERWTRNILGMGVDSLVVLCIYLGGMIILFHLW